MEYIAFGLPYFDVYCTVGSDIITVLGYKPTIPPRQ